MNRGKGGEAHAEGGRINHFHSCLGEDKRKKSLEGYPKRGTQGDITPRKRDIKKEGREGVGGQQRVRMILNLRFSIRVKG